MNRAVRSSRRNGKYCSVSEKNCLLYIGGEVKVHEGGEGLMVEKKMVERVILKKEKGEKWEKVEKEKVVGSNCDFYIVGERTVA